jgi:hypothetical protein
VRETGSRKQKPNPAETAGSQSLSLPGVHPHLNHYQHLVACEFGVVLLFPPSEILFTLGIKLYVLS